jgi:two-component system, chemotaxis family, sensor histidine kinase and response regulator WspE
VSEPADLSQSSMLDLFRTEAESQGHVLTTSLLALERDHEAADHLEACMRAAHSLKGAARIVGLPVGVTVAHAMEDCFVAAQEGRIVLRQGHIDVLLRGVDLLGLIAEQADGEGTGADEQRDAFVAALRRLLDGAEQHALPEHQVVSMPPVIAPNASGTIEPGPPSAGGREGAERVVRVTADRVNRLLALAGEAMVESRWLTPFASSLLRLKRLQYGSAHALDGLRGALAEATLDERARTALAGARRTVLECQQFLSERLVDLEMFDRRAASLSSRLYEEALACRMRPFADGMQAFPRAVRDLAQSLAKRVRLEIVGETTQIDRDVLERLDAPLDHLLRNAIDHGIESPEERQAAGKPVEGVVRIEARHSAGALYVTVSDDGCGVDLEKVRAVVAARHLTSPGAAAALSDNELLEFLFLPGFTMKDALTEISGRGVGLDVVRNMLKELRGTVRVSSQSGHGTCFELQLPVTLSVVRTLLVDIRGEPYAFPLVSIVRAMKLAKERIEMLEGHEHFAFDGRHLGLVAAHQLLAGAASPLEGAELSVVVVGDGSAMYGLVVDRFLGQRELVVQPLDPRLGKVKDIAAAALMEDGTPVLIVDVEDMIRSVEKLVATGRLSKVRGGGPADTTTRKRVLVVDDSLTVRELERKLLQNRGYDVEVAVDGMDGWNAVRTGTFDLVVTDVDMPRMDGIELLTLIRKDAHLRSLPVMVVSYKDREEDRRRGLDAGADYYLPKANFHDETLLRAVVDLIGDP